MASPIHSNRGRPLRLRSGQGCDCLVCFGLRLATGIFLMGMVALLLLAAFLRAGEREARPPARLQDGAAAARHSGVLRDATAQGLAEVVPPERFRADAAAVALFSSAAVAQACGGAIACAGRNAKGIPIVALPHPCALAGREIYATILCHELGHVNGWPGTHGD